MNSVSDFLIDSFPYITWSAIKAIFEYENLTRIVYSFVLTSILSQFIVYKNIIANTEKNRKLIQSLFDNPQNEYDDNIFHRKILLS